MRGRRLIGLPGALLLLLVVCVALVALIGVRARDAMAAYSGVVSDVDQLRGLDLSDSVSLSRARPALASLATDVDQFDAAIRPPFGEPVVAALPWVGPRYRAARDLLEIGRLGAASGLTVVDALGSADLSQPQSVVAALGPHAAELQTVSNNVRTIQSLRSGIDASVLPSNVQSRLAQLDALLARPELSTLTTVQIAPVLDALGASRPVRYLVLFQNPAELRPTGGFPGTVALLTIDHGSLSSAQFFDVHELTQAYLAHRQTPLPQPWPIERFFPQPEFLLHDATWWPDFSRSAAQMMDMYAQSGWPPIDGVIAVQPEVASRLIRVTGPFAIEFDGDKRTITADNVYDEIERQRRSHLESVEEGTIHKQMLGLIGQTLIERLKNAGKAHMLSAAEELAAACQTREIQAYSPDPAVEAELDRQACTGRMQPEPDEPTLAVTFANLVLSKTSQDMRPKLTLSLDAPRDGKRKGQLDIDLRDGAVPDEDPVYAGFQRWWVEVSLPPGSTLLSDPGPMEDPEAPNGGSYLAALFPDQTGRITVRFSMPDSPTLLVRRQPGVRPGDVLVTTANCPSPSFSAVLDKDLTVDLGQLC